MQSGEGWEKKENRSRRSNRLARVTPSSHSDAVLCEVVHGRLRPLQQRSDGKVYPGHAQDSQIHRKHHRFLPVTVRRALLRLRSVLLPDADGVTREYWYYARWRFAQRIASSALGVLATQQLLFAVGVGARSALPTAAVLNWVLKDGLGRLGKLAVTAYYGDRIDADIKRFRFTSSIVYNLAHALEIVTPAFPSQFLLLATIANIGKSIGITTGNVCRAPIQMTFAKNNNVGEIAARTSAQQVVADNIGLGLSVAIMWSCRHMPVMQRAIPFFMYPLLAFIDLGGIHKELEHVSLTSLNKERVEILTRRWLESRSVLTPAEVAKIENYFLPEAYHALNVPLRLVALHKIVPDVDSVQALTRLYKSRNEAAGHYVLQYEQRAQTPLQNIASAVGGPLQSAPTGGYKGQIRIAIDQAASSENLLVAMLQAEHLRSWLVTSRESPATQESLQCLELLSSEINVALERSYSMACDELKTFVNALKGCGWDVDSVYIDGPHAPKFCYLRP